MLLFIWSQNVSHLNVLKKGEWTFDIVQDHYDFPGKQRIQADTQAKNLASQRYVGNGTSTTDESICVELELNSFQKSSCTLIVTNLVKSFLFLIMALHSFKHKCTDSFAL
jgi:hypothetical protein